VSVLYRHRQNGTVILMGVAIAGASAVLGFCLAWSQAPSAIGWPVAFVVVPVLAVLAAPVWYFGSMTIEVTESELRWHFRPKRYFKVARSDIDGISAVRHPWLWGYGIRWVGPKRWAYIVAGREAVEVRLRSGGWRRLGTDDQKGLIAALTAGQSG
jgi:hypothetical protein